jgi:hypothetical protein
MTARKRGVSFGKGEEGRGSDEPGLQTARKCGRKPPMSHLWVGERKRTSVREEAREECRRNNELDEDCKCQREGLVSFEVTQERQRA